MLKARRDMRKEKYVNRFARLKIVRKQKLYFQQQPKATNMDHSAGVCPVGGRWKKKNEGVAYS